LDNEHNLFLIAVGGIRGVGKSSTLDRALQLFPKIEVIHVGDRLKEFSVAQTGIYFFDHADSTKDIIRESFSISLLESLLGGIPTFLDLHFTDIDEEPEKSLQPNIFVKEFRHFILLDASDSTILERRRLDLSRERHMTVNSIRHERDSEFKAIQNAAHMHKKTLTLIDTEMDIDTVAVRILDSIGILTQPDKSDE